MPQPHIFFGNTGGGGGGSGTVQNVLDEGVLVLANAVELNFVGAGVTASNAGAGRAQITIPGGSTVLPLYHAVTAPELAAKQFTLPLGAFSFFIADIVDGAVLQDTVDFAVIGNQFNWNGLGLDGVIAEGDVVRFVYAP